MRKILHIGVFLAMLAYGQHGEGATFYVATSGNDGNSCSAAQNIGTPRQTVQAGQSCLSGGDELVVRGGTYVNQMCVTQFNFPSGSPGNPTRLVGFPGETVVMRTTTSSSCGGESMISTDTSTDWEFENLILDAVNSHNACTRTSQLGSRRLTFRNMIYRYCLIGWQGGGAEIRFEDVEVMWSGFDENHNFVSDDGGLGAHGIYFTGFESSFERVHTHHNTGIGITLSCEGCGSTLTGVTIARSSSHHNWGYGFLLYGGNALYDSITWLNGNTGNSTGVLTGGSSDYINNTIYGNDQAGFQYNGGFSTVRNNIILDNAAGAVVFNGGSASMDHNICDGGCDMSGSASIFINASGGNFRPASETVASVNTGNQSVPSGTPSVDFDGESRTSGGARDVGAFEFVTGTSTPTNGNPIYASVTASAAADCFIPESPSTPTSLAHGITCLTFPGKILELANGTYNGKFDTGSVPITGGTGPSARTTITGKAGATVIIQLPASGGFDAVVRLQTNTNWLHFNNLTLDAMSRPESNGVSIEAGSNLLFTNLTIRNATFQLFGHFGSAGTTELRDSTLTNAELDCIALSGGSGTVTIDNNRISQCGTKIIEGHSAPTNFMISRNIMHHGGLAGTMPAVYFEEIDNATLINNIIHTSNAGIHLPATATNTKMYHNTLVGMTNYGLQCDLGATGTVATNNISVGNGSSIGNNCGATLQGNIQTGALATIFVNPGANDYRLIAGSPAINAGVALPTVTQDIIGTSRPQPAGGAWDAGAYEFFTTGISPTLTITAPVNTPTYTTDTTPLTSLGGVASDDVGVTSVTVSCSPSCGSPAVSCPTCGAAATSVTWTVASIPLVDGITVITVTPHDSGGPGTADTLTVTKTGTPIPPVPGTPAMSLFFH